MAKTVDRPHLQLRAWHVAVAALAIYALVYGVMSAGGIYRPGAVGLNGIKWFEWTPRGYVDTELRSRKAVFAVFFPLWYLDVRYWHHDRFGTPSDPRINFRGTIIDASRLAPPPGAVP